MTIKDHLRRIYLGKPHIEAFTSNNNEHMGWLVKYFNRDENKIRHEHFRTYSGAMKFAKSKSW